MSKITDFFKNKLREFTFGEWAILADFLLLIFFIKNQLYFLMPMSIAIGVCLLCFVLMGRDDKHIDDKKIEDYRDCILALLAKVMNYDGNQTNAELDRVKITIRRYYLTLEEQKKALDNFLEYLRCPDLTYVRYCDYIKKELNDTAQKEILMELMAVAYADGEYLSSEEYIIKSIAKNLNISDFQYKSIEIIFKRKKSQGSYYDFSKNDYNYYSHIDSRYCFLVLLAEVMKADGRQMSCELDCIKTFIRKNYAESEQKKALQKFKEILDNQYDLESICLNIKYRINDQEKEKFVTDLLEVKWADDVNAESEENVIRDIVYNLGISQNKYYRIKNNFRKKNNKTSYKNSNKKSKKKEYNNNKQDDSKKSNNYNNSNSSNSGSSNSNSNSNNKRKESMSGNEACTILGVDVLASDEEIKKAYRAMAIKYHPDRVSHLGEETIRQATETMKQINMAWDTIKDIRGIK